jgi:transcriptional regulator with XRE-family HTH domain
VSQGCGPAFGIPGTEKAFGQALREIRKSRNLSQEQLALDSDFDRTYVSLLERGLQSPTVRTIVKLAATLDVRPSVMIRRIKTYSGFDGGTEGPGAQRRAEETVILHLGCRCDGCTSRDDKCDRRCFVGNVLGYGLEDIHFEWTVQVVT